MVTETAPQEKDDTTEVDLSKIPTPGDARMAAIDTISDGRVAQLAEDNELNVGDIRDAAEPIPEPEPEPEPEPDEVIDPESQIAKAMVEDEENTFVTIKVNGVEQDVSIADLKGDAQKVKSASQKFEDAARLRREAEEIIEKSKNTPVVEATPVSNTEEPAAAVDTSELPAIDADAVKSLMENIYSGDEEAATAAMIELLQQNGRDNNATTHDEQPVDTTAVAAEVMSQINRTNALDEFKSEFADVWKNPMLAGQADTILATKLDEGVEFKEALMESGKEVRELLTKAAHEMGLVTPKPKEDPAGEKTNKSERKKEIDNIPSSGKTASTTVAEEAPESVSSVIAGMAEQRGANRHF